SHGIFFFFFFFFFFFVSQFLPASVPLPPTRPSLARNSAMIPALSGVSDLMPPLLRRRPPSIPRRTTAFHAKQLLLVQSPTQTARRLRGLRRAPDRSGEIPECRSRT